MKRQVAAVAFALAVLSTTACGYSSTSKDESLPVEHVLLVSIDTLRADHVGAYGGRVPTRAMDALAREGVLFEESYTPTPSTGPAHVSLLTGLHPWNHGVLFNAVPIEDTELPNVAVFARGAGFATAAFVSSYVLHARWGFDRGFETYRFEPEGNRRIWKGEWVDFATRGGRTTDAALAWIEKHQSEPFFVWVHYFDPHNPYEPPAEYRRPANDPVDLRNKSLPKEISSWESLIATIRAYRGEVAYVDHQIERLVEGLRDLGLLDQTAVVVTSDHGEGLGDHGHMTHGWNLHEELVRIPLIVRAPGIPRNSRLSGPVQLEDLMPTLLALMGLRAPEGLDGRNLLPWIRCNAPASPRESVVGQRAPFPNHPVLFFERRGPAKWIGELSGGGRVYRLDKDPAEQQALDAPMVSATLSAIAPRRGKAESKPVWDEEALRALRALGYVE